MTALDDRRIRQTIADAIGNISPGHAENAVKALAAEGFVSRTPSVSAVKRKLVEKGLSHG